MKGREDGNTENRSLTTDKGSGGSPRDRLEHYSTRYEKSSTGGERSVSTKNESVHMYYLQICRTGGPNAASRVYPRTVRKISDRRHGTAWKKFTGRLPLYFSEYQKAGGILDLHPIGKAM